MFSTNTSYEEFPEIYKPKHIEKVHAKFLKSEMIQYLISGMLILSLVLRLIFNMFAKSDVNKIMVDKFLTADLLFATSSLFVFALIE